VVDIMTALATAGHVSKLLKELLGIDKAVNAAEFKFKIAELTEAVSPSSCHSSKLRMISRQRTLRSSGLRSNSSERQT
jgi:hypothetical protein